MRISNKTVLKLARDKGALERALLSSSTKYAFLTSMRSELDNLYVFGGKVMHIRGDFNAISGEVFVEVRAAEHYFSKEARCRFAQVFVKVPGKWSIRMFHPNGKIEHAICLTVENARRTALQFVLNASKRKKNRSKKIEKV